MGLKNDGDMEYRINSFLTFDYDWVKELCNLKTFKKTFCLKKIKIICIYFLLQFIEAHIPILLVMKFNKYSPLAVYYITIYDNARDSLATD